MSRLSLARRERHDVCDLALVLGADSPTLCGDWTAHQLMAHLFVREHRPISGLGITLSPLSGLTDRAMARAERTAFDVLVEKVREPGLTLFALKPVEVFANTLEYVVHHEDLRRAQPDWTPRELNEADLDTIWRPIKMMGRTMLRSIKVPVVVQRTDTGETATLRKGAGAAMVSGPVVELLMFFFGRTQVNDLVFDGPNEAVAALRGARFGI